MGMCHMNRNAPRGSRDESCDTASTDRDCPRNIDVVTPTNNFKNGYSEASTRTDLNHFQANPYLTYKGNNKGESA